MRKHLLKFTVQRHRLTNRVWDIGGHPIRKATRRKNPKK